MVFPLIAQFFVALVLNVVSYALTPKPKSAAPESVTQLEEPTAEAGTPPIVIFGTVWVLQPNIVWFGDKSSLTYEVNA